MKNITLWIGGIMFALLVFVMFAGQYLPFIDQTLTPEKHRWSQDERLILPPYEPSSKNLLGSDKDGVDNLSKIIMGTKETLLIIFSITALRYMIAVPLGLSAYRKSGVANSILTVWNQLFSYLPTLFSAILLLSLPFLLFASWRLLWVILILAAIEVGRVAYLIQQQIHQISREPFVEAGHALGLSPWRLTRSYFIPTMIPEIVVNFCVDLGKVTLLIGQLGVLSIFLSQEWVEVNEMSMILMNTSNNWMSLLASMRADIYVSKFTYIFYPALAIMFTILTFNVLGEGIRRHFNRRIHNYL
ncbi:ABC transporter permease subunit [Paenibacillus sp. UMB4589-SE434]|uniref:ABC transporter permease n=1 Tax=Paenibacillus sp. UMB4589-SE434 TaxID=3046314 RepID=UPI00254FF087|nr:ABC transporter permease subunit [Paenibacillus sp. UMB4589-SE434]MDK8183950.1 ABC transporter permease subunit [Paenibacillus sp. UMB4589-SE434]